MSLKNRLARTIAAIATGPCEAGVSIIRLSGEDALPLLRKIFKPAKKIKQFKPRYLYYGQFLDGDRILDSGLAVYFKDPHSFTGEDVVELHLHGGFFNTRQILEFILTQGILQAERGEFTERAFLNGKLDLIQAESILDVIHSRNSYTHDNALQQLRGSLSDQFRAIKQNTEKIVSITEAAIDFPEEDYDFLAQYNIKEQVNQMITTLQELSNSYYDGKIFSQGASVAIIGPPNAGKSSLLNALLKLDRALVTEIPGTTRDYIEADLTIKGIPITLVDTAGVRETKDQIEQQGVELALSKLESADLTLYLLDERGYLPEMAPILEKLKHKKHLIIQNKIDLAPKLEADCYISAKNRINIDILQDLIFEQLISKEFNATDLFITNSRHKIHIDEALAALETAATAINDQLYLEFIATDLRLALNHIGEILGEVTTEDLLGNIFGQFCLGK